MDCKIVFVDDEVNNLRLLEKILNWEKNGFKVAGSFSDPFQAFEFIKENAVDVVFVDMVMPKMDGIELIKNIREVDKETAIVILSAHSKFEYAQKALEYNVFKYLVKPITRKDVFECAEMIREKFVKDFVSEIDLEKIEIVLNAALKNVLLGECNYVDTEKLQQLKGRHLLYVSSKDVSSLSKTSDNYLGEVNILQLGTLFLCEDELVYGTEAGVYSFDTRCFSLYTFINELAVVVNSRFFKQNDTNMNTISSFELLINTVKKQDAVITEAFTENDGEILTNFVNEIITSAEKNSVSALQLIEYCQNYLSNILLIASDFFKSDIAHEFIEKDLLIGEAVDSSSLRDRTNLLTIEVFKKIYDRLGSTYDHEASVQRALIFVDNNFTEMDFSSNMVAKHVGISKNHFLKIYKEVSGDNFWSMVIKKRLEMVKSLLYTDKKLSEISKLTGYENEFHMSNSFKKLYGISPNNFRNSIK